MQGNLASHIARDLLDRLHNGATSNNMSEDRDDDEDERVMKFLFLYIINDFFDCLE